MSQANERPYFPEQSRINEHDVLIEDEFVNEKFEHINDQVARLTDIANDYYQQGPASGVDVGRKRTSFIDMENPATRELAQMLPSVIDWIDTVPTAAALHPLYEPESTYLPNGKKLDENIGDWFKNIADARGIRGRAEVMQGLLERESHDGQEGQKWLSLACGAAQPVFSVLEKLDNEGEVPLPHVTLADIDKNALSLAEGYAASHGLETQIDTKRLNVLRRQGLAYAREPGIAGIAKSALLRSKGRLQPEEFDAVDAVGIFEYLKRPDWEYNYNGVISTKQKMAGAETFLQNSYELVKPGGILIVGNMLDTHPQLGFTLNVIQWPHIQPRSVEDMVDIINKVGLEGEVDVYKPSDGVYALYSIRKPE